MNVEVVYETKVDKTCSWSIHLTMSDRSMLLESGVAESRNLAELSVGVIVEELGSESRNHTVIERDGG